MSHTITEVQLRELRGADGQYPHDVRKLAPRISAYDFSDSSRTAGDYLFGMTRENAAASLRRLADAIEAKQILPQSVRVVTLASGGEFTQSVLRLVFAEKKR